MTTLDDIRAKLPDVGPHQTLVLKTSEIDVPEVANFFREGLNTDTLALTGASANKAGDPITIMGNATVLGYQGLTVTLTFQIQDNALMITLNGAFPVGKDSLHLPLVDWIHLEGLGLSLTQNGSYHILNFAFHGNIAVDSNTIIPVSLSPTSDGGWQLGIAQDSEFPIPEVAHLATLLNGNTLTSFIPDDFFKALNEIKLGHISAVFHLERKTITYFTIEVSVSDGWDVVGDKIQIKRGSMRLIFTLIDPTDPYTRQTIGIVRGTIVIDGTEVPIFIQANVASDTTLWVVGIDPESDGVTLPSLSGLFTYAGGNDLAQSLPASLGNIPELKIDTLEIDFTLSPRTLQQLSFAAGTTHAWPVIEGFFTVEQLHFALDLLNPTDAANRKVGGLVASTFSITDDVWLYFTVQKALDSTDWTLAGGLPPNKSFNLTDLVSKLLSSFVTLPPHVPALIFDTVDVTVVPGKTMSFTAGSHSPWPLLPPNKFVIDTFTLNFNYDTSRTKQPFSGSLATNFTLAGVDARITATLNTSGAGGWSFEGSTKRDQPIDIGHLIVDLENKFGVATIPTDALHSLQLLNIALMFTAGAKAGSPERFHFDCEGKLTLAEHTFDALMKIDLDDQSGTYTGTFTGKLTIQTVSAGQPTEEIDFSFTRIKDESKLTASWKASPGHGLGFEDIAHAFGFSDIPGGIPSSLDLSLQKVDFAYDFTSEMLSLLATTGEGRQAVFLSQKNPPTQKRVYVFGVDIPLNAKLADLPLVGDKLPNADQLGIPAISVWILSDTLHKTEIGQINAAIAGGYPTLPDQDMTSTLSLQSSLLLGRDTVPLSLPLAGTTSQTSQATPASSGGSAPASVAASGSGSSASASSTAWFDVQKTFGIFSFKRIGVSYQHGELGFALDASMTLGGVTLALEGLRVTSPLRQFTPHFHLDGLGIAFAEEPVEIEGTFLAVPAANLGTLDFEYEGSAVIKASNYTLSAVGAYGQVHGDPSLFIFAELDKAFGGPACFYVTGLLGGFGINRKLRLPQQDEVLQFPFVRGLSDPTAVGGTGATPLGVLDVLDGRGTGPDGKPRVAWLTPQAGEYWLAAGIEYTSFQLVNSHAIVVATFGQELELALIGLSTLKLPRDQSETYAYVELELEAILRPSQGFFGITAVLSPNSYVIDPRCKLTGGFAFYTWYDGEHAGDFVLTLGGYHPSFSPPAHYPREPRLSFNWPVDDSVTIHGEAYFALTPSMVMGGGALEVSYQAGDLHAWFTAHADFLISWKPFAYLASIGLSVGASYRLNLLFTSVTVSVELGADLDIWGPPTGGRVHIDWYIISFTVGFGADQPGGQNHLDWPTFKTLLPQEKDINKIVANRGVIQKADDGSWIVRADEFQFSTETAIPSTQLFLGESSTPDLQRSDYHLDIRPMGKAGLNGKHRLKVYGVGASTSPLDLRKDAWKLDARERNVPEALWGQPVDDRRTPAATMLPNRLVGYQAGTPDPELGHSPGSFDLSTSYEPISPGGQMPLSPTKAPDQMRVSHDDAHSVQIIVETLANQQSARDAVRDTLHSLLGDTFSSALPTGLQQAAATLFRDPPLLAGEPGTGTVQKGTSR